MDPFHLKFFSGIAREIEFVDPYEGVRIPVEGSIHTDAMQAARAVFDWHEVVGT